jgi:uncharacterized protein (DUF2147 family)
LATFDEPSEVLPPGFLSPILLASVDGMLMVRISYWIAAAVVALATVVPANAGEPTGTWLIQDRTAKVRIVACGEAICGTVVWLSQPIDVTTGSRQTDKLNADPQMRSRPMLGVAVVLGMQQSGEDNKWLGRIYNPDDGSTYKGSIELIDSTRLKVKGCLSVFCQAEIWTRSN